jgi:hypothetical protein
MEEKKVGFFLPLLQRSALLCIERSAERVFERERERDDYVIN